MDLEQLTPLSEETDLYKDPESNGIDLPDIPVTERVRDTHTQITKQLQDFLPAVTADLSEQSRLEEWVVFFFSLIYLTE